MKAFRDDGILFLLSFCTVHRPSLPVGKYSRRNLSTGIVPTHHFLAFDTNLSCRSVYFSRKPSLEAFSILTIGTLFGRQFVLAIKVVVPASVSLIVGAPGGSQLIIGVLK